MTKSALSQTCPQRIAFIGPECSGKTTLVQHLATALDAYMVPEYFRFYWDAKRHTKQHKLWTDEEFLHMAAEQNRFEDLYAARTQTMLLCDTIGLQIAAWQKHYLGTISSRLLSLAVSRDYDLVVLCQHDISFQQDGVRDGESSRAAMFASLQDLLTKVKVPHLVVEGPIETRAQKVLTWLRQT